METTTPSLSRGLPAFAPAATDEVDADRCWRVDSPPGGGTVTLRAAPPSVKAVPVELGNSLKTIADPELKAVLEALAVGVVSSAGGVPKIK